MAAIVDAIVEQNGEIDPDRTMEIWSGWTHEGPRGHVMIDPETRDIVQDMRVNEVYAEDTAQDAHDRRDPAGQGPCKEQKVGRCVEDVSRPSAPADARSAVWPFGAAQETDAPSLATSENVWSRPQGARSHRSASPPGRVEPLSRPMAAHGPHGRMDHPKCS